MSELVVVSAHLDDAVLSAAVQLMRPEARIVTVCAGVPPEGTPPADWDRLTRATDPTARVHERFVEDDKALGVLGVSDPVRLDFPDGQHVTDADRPRWADLVEALQSVLAGATEVWAPAGIGCHPDHLAVRDATNAAAVPGAVVHYYADVPYSLRYGWPPSVTGDEPGPAYLDVDAWLADELAETGLSGHELARTVYRLDTDAQRRKVTAMACYATQIPALDYGTALADGDPAVVGFELAWTRP